MRISDWSSDVCSSDLAGWKRQPGREGRQPHRRGAGRRLGCLRRRQSLRLPCFPRCPGGKRLGERRDRLAAAASGVAVTGRERPARLRAALSEESLLRRRPEEHTSELQSLMRIAYAAVCLKKQTT